MSLSRLRTNSVSGIRLDNLCGQFVIGKRVFTPYWLKHTGNANSIVEHSYVRLRRIRSGVSSLKNYRSIRMRLYGQYVHDLFHTHPLGERRISHALYGIRRQRRKGGVSTVPVGSRDFSRSVEISAESRKSALTRNSYKLMASARADAQTKHTYTHTYVITNAFGTLTARVYTYGLNEGNDKNPR